MANILEQLADYARLRVRRDREQVSAAQLLAAIDDMERSGTARAPFRFENALRGGELSFICEVKKASPSKGLIDPEFHYREIAREYEAAGADCISCLTEPKWFLGSDAIFREIRSLVDTPMIRKDFTIDEYQIYQAKAMGADAVLLICALLDEKTLISFFRVCEELGLSALVETHDEEEMKMAAAVGGRLIGVNNRNLKDFSVNIDNSRRLRELAPEDALFVSESGIRGPQDIPPLRESGVDAVLVGEALMRSDDKKKTLEALRNA